MARYAPAPCSKSQTSLLSAQNHDQPDVHNSPGTPLPAVHNNNSNYGSRSTEEPEANSPASTSSKRERCRPAKRATDMARQDSGYESNTPRAPLLSSNINIQRTSRQRSAGSTQGSTRGSHSRPAVRRSSKSGGGGSGPSIRPPTTAYNSSKPLAVSQTTPFSANPHALSYFTFPTPNLQPQEPVADRTPSPCMPPQTTYYWTSDGTRRMEYDAIDKATHGFQGWVMRNLVPSCFIPKDQRRTTFDDDTGSVRRYRIALEGETSEKSNPEDSHGGQEEDASKKKKKKWLPFC